MNRLAPVLLMLLAMGSPGLGQVPTPAPKPDPPAPAPAPVVAQAVITTAPTVPAGTPILLYGDKSTSTGPLSWKLISPKVAFQVYDQDGRTGTLAVVKNPDPGTYKFVLIATGSSGSYDFDFADVVVLPPPTPNPGPPAPPVPTPTPTPAPAPAVTYSRPAHVTLVVDSSKPDPKLAVLRDSPTIAASLQAINARWHVVDVASAEYARRNLAATVAAAGGAPCLLFQGSPATTGGSSSSFSLARPSINPTATDSSNEAAVLAQITTVLGGKN